MMADFVVSARTTDPMGPLLAEGYGRLAAVVDKARTKGFAEDFTETGWNAISGTNSWTTANTIAGGSFLRGNSGNQTVARGYNASGGVNARVPCPISLDEGTPFWIGFGFRVVTPISSTWNLMSFRDINSNVAAAVGYYGPSSTTKFAGYLYNGSNEDDTLSTVSVDGGEHRAELWFIPLLGFFMSIDNETPIAMAHPHPFSGTPVSPCWMYSASTTAFADVFWRGMIWPVGYTI